MKKLTHYDLNKIFDHALTAYLEAPAGLDSQQQRAYAFLKASQIYLQNTEIDYRELGPKSKESIFAD